MIICLACALSDDTVPKSVKLSASVPPEVNTISPVSATIKFGFLIVGAIFFLIALALFIIKKIKKQD